MSLGSVAHLHSILTDWMLHHLKNLCPFVGPNMLASDTSSDYLESERLVKIGDDSEPSVEAPDDSMRQLV